MIYKIKDLKSLLVSTSKTYSSRLWKEKHFRLSRIVVLGSARQELCRRLKFFGLTRHKFKLLSRGAVTGGRLMVRLKII